MCPLTITANRSCCGASGDVMKLFCMLNSEQEVLNRLSLYALVLNCCSKGQVVKASRISCWRSHELFSEAGEPEQHLPSTQILLLWLGKFTWNSPQFKKKTGKMFQLLLLCQRYQFSSCCRVKECGHESSSCRHKLSWLQSQEAVNIIMWWTGWSRSVGWLLRYNGPQNTWHKIFFAFWRFEYLLIQASIVLVLSSQPACLCLAEVQSWTVWLLCLEVLWNGKEWEEWGKILTMKLCKLLPSVLVTIMNCYLWVWKQESPAVISQQRRSCFSWRAVSKIVTQEENALWRGVISYLSSSHLALFCS